MGGPGKLSSLSPPLPTSLPYFLQESLSVGHIHPLSRNELSPNSTAEISKNKNQACHSGSGVQSKREEYVPIRPSLPSEAKAEDPLRDAGYG